MTSDRHWLVQSALDQNPRPTVDIAVSSTLRALSAWAACRGEVYVSDLDRWAGEIEASARPRPPWACSSPECTSCMTITGDCCRCGAGQPAEGQDLCADCLTSAEAEATP